MNEFGILAETMQAGICKYQESERNVSNFPSTNECRNRILQTGLITKHGFSIYICVHLLSLAEMFGKKYTLVRF
jgi:hypothetical protein